MTGDLIEIAIVMWIVATAAFAPLGYFIYMYSKKSGRPFGETEPHGDSESWVLNLAESAINFVKGLIGKK